MTTRTGRTDWPVQTYTQAQHDEWAAAKVVVDAEIVVIKDRMIARITDAVSSFNVEDNDIDGYALSRKVYQSNYYAGLLTKPIEG